MGGICRSANNIPPLVITALFHTLTFSFSLSLKPVEWGLCYLLFCFNCWPAFAALCPGADTSDENQHTHPHWAWVYCFMGKGKHSLPTATPIALLLTGALGSWSCETVFLCTVMHMQKLRSSWQEVLFIICFSFAHLFNILRKNREKSRPKETFSWPVFAGGRQSCTS